jgi:hypothetical protein
MQLFVLQVLGAAVGCVAIAGAGSNPIGWIVAGAGIGVGLITFHVHGRKVFAVVLVSLFKT